MADKGIGIKKIPLKNYIILAVIFCISMGIVIYFCNWYKVYDQYQRQTPVIRETLSEITVEELDHYIMENPTTIIYMCTASDLTCRNYEKDFKKIIEKNDLQEDIIYLNLSNTNLDEFTDNFNNNYNYKVKLTNYYPSLVVFEDGKVTNILQGTSDKKLTATKTQQFIDMNKIGE